MKCQQQRQNVCVCVASNLIQSSNQSHHYLIIPLNLRTYLSYKHIYNAINLICLSLGLTIAQSNDFDVFKYCVCEFSICFIDPSLCDIHTHELL